MGNKMKRISPRAIIAGLLIIAVIFGILIMGFKLGLTPLYTYDKKTQENIEKAVSDAVKKQWIGTVWPGETLTEGHVILSTENKTDRIIVYTIANYGPYGYKDGKFTMVGGSGAIPMVIEFSKTNGKLTLISCTEPCEGDNLHSSLRQMFPISLWEEVFNSEKYISELTEQQEKQAKEFLKNKKE